MFKAIREDLDAFLARDPAARSRLEVALLYPGFHALAIHHLTHALWRWKWRLFARFLSQFGRFLTGVEIHPGAAIGRRLVIDHGMGVVIGEGARVGANSVVTKEVPPGMTAIGIPAQVVMPKDRNAARAFVAYGTPAEGCPDPVLLTIENLRSQISDLKERVGDLESQLRAERPRNQAS